MKKKSTIKIELDLETATTLVQALQRAIEVETPRKLTKNQYIKMLATKMANGHSLTKKELEFLNQEP